MPENSTYENADSYPAPEKDAGSSTLYGDAAPSVSGSASTSSTPAPSGQPATPAMTPAQLLQQNEQLSGKVSDLEMYKQFETVPVLEKMAKVAKDSPAAPQLEQMPQYKPEDPKERASNLHSFMGAAGLFALLAGVIGRNHIGSAVSALSGAFEGYHKGEMEKAEQKRVEFNQQMNAIKERNNAMLNEFKMAQEKHGNDLDGLRVEAEVIAAKYGTPIAAKNAQMGHNQGVLNYYAMVDKTNAQMAMAAAKLNISMENTKSLIETRKAKAGAGTPAQAAANTKIDNARKQLDDMFKSDPKSMRSIFSRGTDSIINDKVVGPVFTEAMKQKNGGDPLWRDLKNWELGFPKNPGPPPTRASGPPAAGPPKPAGPPVSQAGQTLLGRGGKQVKVRDKTNGSVIDAIQMPDGKIYNTHGDHLG